MDKYFQKIYDEIENRLSRTRFLHIQGVIYTAASLAMAHNVSIRDAMLGGLFHDCTKEWTKDMQVQYCKSHHIELSKTEKENYRLLHAKTGAIYAREKYGIDNEEILSAIQYHTTGKSNMSDLEKVLYIADYIEPNREMLPNMNAVRSLAFQNLDICMYRLTKDSLAYLKKKGFPIDHKTMDAFLFYDQLLSKKEKEIAYGR